MSNKDDVTTTNSTSKEMLEFITFIKESQNLFPGDSFEQVLGNNLKMDMYLNIYCKLKALPTQLLANLAIAAKNIVN